MLPWLFTAALAGVRVPGTTVDLAPPPGFELAPDFAGFRDVDRSASILIAELPGDAHAELAPLFADPAAGAAGFASKGVTVRRALTIRSTDGAPVQLLVGSQTQAGATLDKYVALSQGERTVLVTFQAPRGAISLREVKATLSSLTHLPPPTLEEELAALPFRFTAPAPLRVVDTYMGAGALLTIGPLDVDPDGVQPQFILSAQTGDRAINEATAEAVLRAITGYADVTVDSAAPVPWSGGEAIRVTGHVPGYFVVFHLLAAPGAALIALARVPDADADALGPTADALATSIVFGR
jgi:hypothetical protein